MVRPVKIISGGQSGADFGALRAGEVLVFQFLVTALKT
jgi:hypothetical protein